jgi:hypothetical protein
MQSEILAKPEHNGRSGLAMSQSFGAEALSHEGSGRTVTGQAGRLASRKGLP